MKRIILIFPAAFAFFACSEGGNLPEEPLPPAPPEPEKTLPQVRIETADNGKNVFEIMQFDVSIEGFESEAAKNPFLSMFYLADHYDSLVWRIPDRGMEYKLFECREGYERFMSSFGHNFCTPGEIDTRLSGYKDGEEVYSYAYPVKVNNNKDFICFNWADVTEDSKSGTGYHDVFTEDQGWHFSTSLNIHDGVPSANLYIFPGGGKELTETEERHKLFDEIRNLYGEPAYGNDDAETEADTMEKYGELFHYIEDNSQPLSIWITGRSKIVLLRRGDDMSDPAFPVPPHRRYIAYAEPI